MDRDKSDSDTCHEEKESQEGGRRPEGGEEQLGHLEEGYSRQRGQSVQRPWGGKGQVGLRNSREARRLDHRE